MTSMTLDFVNSFILQQHRAPNVIRRSNNKDDDHAYSDR
jgi:hypothetical protein